MSGEKELNENTWVDPKDWPEEKKRRAALKRQGRARRVLRANKFAESYVRNGCSVKAVAEEMGVRPTTADTWLAKTITRNRIAKLVEQALAKSEVTIDELVRRYNEDDTQDRTQLYDEDEKTGMPVLKRWSKIPDELKPLIEGVDYKVPKGMSPIPVVKLVSKHAAREMLAKYLKMPTERLEVDASDSLVDRILEARKRVAKTD